MMISALYYTNRIVDIIKIQSQPVFALTHSYVVLSGEATNTNFIVFGLTRLSLKTTTYHTRGKHANH